MTNNLKAIHNKDYSDVKTVKAASLGNTIGCLFLCALFSDNIIIVYQKQKNSPPSRWGVGIKYV